MDLKDNWTLLQTSKLISLYKSFPNLWNCNHKYYKNKALRRNCLRNIAKSLTKVKPETSINDVRGKLKTLRSQYGKEKRRRETIVSKRGADEYKAKLWCYDDIKFIDGEAITDGNGFLDDTVEETRAMDDTMIAELLQNESNSDTVEEKIETRGRPSRFPGWTKEQTFTLIKMLKQNPLLYDTTHPQYANPIHRAKAFRDILEELKDYKPTATIPDMRAKLKTLRSQYLKEKQMLKTSMERKGRVKYIPKLWCFDHLKFLDERGKFLEEERALSLSNQEKEFEVGEQPDDCYVGENEDEIYVKSFDDDEIDEIVPTPQSPVSEEVSRTTLHQKCLSLVESLTNQMRHERESSHSRDENVKTPQALLGKMVETDLSKVSEDVFEETKWKIIKLLEEASKKNRDRRLRAYIAGD